MIPHAKQDNVENEKLPSTIQVIDPSHPLFGLAFSSTNLITPIGRKWIFIKMSSGYRRAIPRSATSLDQPALDLESVRQLPRLSVPLMLRLQQVLETKQEPKDENRPKAQGKERPLAGTPFTVASTDTAAAGADRGRDDTHPTPVATSSGDTR